MLNIILKSIGFALLEAAIIARAEEIDRFQTSSIMDESGWDDHIVKRIIFPAQNVFISDVYEKNVLKKNKKNSLPWKKFLIPGKTDVKNGFPSQNLGIGHGKIKSFDGEPTTRTTQTPISSASSSTFFSGLQLNEEKLSDLLKENESGQNFQKLAEQVKHIYLGVPLYPYFFRESRIIVQKSGDLPVSRALLDEDGRNGPEKPETTTTTKASVPKESKIIFLSPASFVPNSDFAKEFAWSP